MLKTLFKSLRLRGTSSIFDRGYAIQFELNGLGNPKPVPEAGLRIKRDVCYHAQPERERFSAVVGYLCPRPQEQLNDYLR